MAHILICISNSLISTSESSLFINYKDNYCINTNIYMCPDGCKAAILPTSSKHKLHTHCICLQYFKCSMHMH